MGICEKRFGCIYITSRTVPHTTLGLYTLFFLERELSLLYYINARIPKSQPKRSREKWGILDPPFESFGLLGRFGSKQTLDGINGSCELIL